MLKKLDYDADFDDEVEQDRSYLLSPAFYLDLIKRRWLLVVLPILVITPIGVAVAMLWPPTYLSEGKILVQSQQIPTELVRPTVTSAAQERIQVIEQRTMTRDNLIAIADKFKLFPGKRTLMSATELVEQIKKQTKIEPVNLDLDFKSRRPTDNPTIVFSVGFEYSDPAVAAQVANELMTRILNEDLRDRTSRATDTTKFLAREVQKLQAENAALDAKITELRMVQSKPSGGGAAGDQPTMLSQLRAELLQKSALYSERHPAIQSLKKQIKALEAAAALSAKSASTDGGNLDALVVQQDALQKNLEAATAKLSVAKLGENLEKDQQSEKLEVIEQPTAPQRPVKPNRPKIVALTFLLALASGVGFTMALEMLDNAIRRSSDLAGIIDGQLMIAIPYIVTDQEVKRRRWRIGAAGALIMLCAVAVVVGLMWFVDLDLVIAKARVGLFK